MTHDQEKTVREAIAYVLSRAQTDPNLGYYLGPATEACERLVAAEAILSGENVDAVRARRGKDLSESRQSEVDALKAQLERATAWGDHARHALPDDEVERIDARVAEELTTPPRGGGNGRGRWAKTRSAA